METNKLIADLVASTTPVRRSGSVLRRIRPALVGAIVSVGSGFLLMGTRVDLAQQWTRWTFIIETISLFSFAAWTSMGALQLSIPGHVRSTKQVWISLIAVCVWIGVVLLRLAFDMQHPEFVWRPDTHYMCMIAIITFSVVPYILLVRSAQRAYPLYPKTISALAGLSSATCAALGMQFICVHDDPLHILTWHALPIFVMGIGSVLVAPDKSGNQPLGH